MQYHRVYIKGACYFFTLVTEKRRPIFKDEKQINILRESFKKVMKKYPFTINAIVVLPDHLHCIWTLPEGDHDYSTRWRLIKTGFSKNCDKTNINQPNQARIRKKQQAIWQHRFWEHMIRNEQDYHEHIDYIHYNPVKHGYTNKAVDWPYSSLHQYIKDGIIPKNWGVSGIEIPNEIGKE
ncbi:transposase [Methyloprofundus sedimenti]|uniref:Transposase n=1 Tax=Methyloprofundus sedimenti TaxID=1420851 RepID=A0A1V8M4J2_9GAMM|nr:transposase [Methyloprofundus sedimenti]OQK16487.1 transposase [Methyloprofundus sedimenti]